MKPVRLFNITTAAFMAAILFLAGTVSAQIDELYCPPGGLSLTKEVSTRLGHYGDNINYTLRVTNSDYGTFEAIEIADTLAMGAEYLDGSASDGGIYDPAARVLTWSIPSLAPTETVVLTFTMNTAPNGTDTLVILNRAYIISPISQKSNWVITWIKPNIPPQAILAIEKIADKAQAYPGDTVTYTLTAGNSGEVSAYNILVTDNIPEHSQIIPATVTSGGIYDAGNNQVRWVIAELAPEASVSLNFQVAVDLDAPVNVNMANIGVINLPDSTIADTAITYITTPPGPALSLDKSVSMVQAYAGDTLTYFLTAHNQGDAPAFEITIIDPLPAEVDYLPATATNGVVYDENNRQLIWTIPAMEPGQMIDLSFQAAISPDIMAGTNIANFALIPGPDTTFSDTVTTEVLFKPITRLTINKSVDKRNAYQYDTLTYTLKIANAGNIDFSAVDIRDSLPPFTEFVPGSITGGGVFDSETSRFIWLLEEIAPDESVEVSFKAMVLINPTLPMPINNFAFSINPDGIYSDTVTTVIMPIIPPPNFYIDKSVDKSEAYSGDTLGFNLTAWHDGQGIDFNIWIVDSLPNNIQLIPGTLVGDGWIDFNSKPGLIYWDNYNIYSDDTVRLNFKAIVEPMAAPGQVVTNYAFYYPESNITDSTVTTIIPRPAPHLVIDKIVDKPQAYAGDTLTYFITIGNDGDSAAYDINVSDALPDNTDLIEGSIDNGGVFNPASGNITWHLVELGVEEQVTVSFKAVLSDFLPFDTKITNIALASIPENTAADTVTTTIILFEGIRLHFEKSVSPTRAYPGDEVNYGLTVRNSGSEAATDVTIVDTLSSMTTHIPGTISHGGQYNPDFNGIVWTLATVNPGEIITLGFSATINLAAPANSDAMNIAALTYDETRLVDSASVYILEKPISDLTLDKMVDKAEAYAGDTLTYSLHLQNTGETAISSVRIQDHLPQYTLPVLGSVTGGGSYDFETDGVYWNIESLPAGADLELTFKVSIVTYAPLEHIIDNYAMIYSPDEIFSDTVHTSIVEKPFPGSLRLDKAVDKATAERGDTLTYSLRLENNGEIPVSHVFIQDQLPPYTQFVPGSIIGGGSYDFETESIYWSLESIPSEVILDLSFKVRIDDEAPLDFVINNYAMIYSPDDIYSDTVRTTITEQQGEPNLVVDKIVDLTEAFAGDTLTYTILVKNEGDGVADEVTVLDKIPDFAFLLENSISEGGYYDEEFNLVFWDLETVTPEDEYTLSFRVVIEPEASDELVIMNIAQAYLGEAIIADTVYTDILPPEQPDILKIVKQVDSLVAARGSVITYDIRVTNTSDGYLRGIMVWDTLPTYTSYVAGSATAGGDYDPQLNRVVWDWQNINIAPGHTIELSFKALINDNAPGSHRLNNTAYASLDVPDDVPVKAAALAIFPSNVVTTIVNIPTGPQDDPVVTKEVDLPVAAPGNTLTYTIAVTNPGPDPINPVMMVDTIPENTTYVPGSISGGGTYSGIDNRISWTFGPLAVEETAIFTFQVTIDSEAADGSQISNRASLTAPAPVQSDPAMTLVRRDLFLISKAVDKDIVFPGDTVTYTITYNNATGSNQNDVTITDPLPVELSYLAGSASGGGTYSTLGRAVIWSLGTVAAGEIGTRQFQAAVSTDAPNNQQIYNIAAATGQSFSPVQSLPVLITVRIPALGIIKEATPSVVAPGDTVLYHVVVANNESSPIANAIVVDNLPNGFTYVANSILINGEPGVATGENPLSIPLGTLAGLGTVVIEYSLAVPLTANANEIYANSAVLHGRDQFGRDIEIGPAVAEVSLLMPRLRLTKTSGVASGIVGSLIPFTIMVENISDVTFTGVIVTDSMSDGMFYVPGTSLINGVSIADPTGSNPYYWNLGNMVSGQSVTLQYTAQLGASARPGVHENVAWAEGNFGSTPVRTADAFARVNILPTTIPGAIRGRVVVDCDGDGIPESEDVPVGADIYLDDGSQSKVNEKGIFYFGTVRPGVRVVALDIRDLDGFYVPEGAEASVFVHVNESGESYVTLRVCPMLKIDKKAAILPKVKVTKAAKLKSTDITDTSGVTIDYEIIIQTNGGALPTLVKVVDSFPSETRLIIHQDQPLVPRQTHNVLTYEVTVQEQKMQQSVYYSLEDLSPGIRRFLTNKIYLEGNVSVATEKTEPVFSPPTEVSVGPFKRIPSRDIQLNVVGALFETSKAKLQPEAFPVLRTVADTALQYLDAALRVEGHADYRPIHTREFPSNWELSSARAKAVVDWLVTEAGVDSTRISYEGFAATRPVDSGRTAEALQKNRRVEVLIKARQEGGIDMSQITTDRWASTTSLELNPVRYDSVFVMPPIPIETGLDDTWEVLIVVENASNRATAKAIVRDSLPSGVVLNDDKIRINGREIPAINNVNGIVEIPLGSIPAQTKVEIRYRVKAIEGTTPAGGGKAILSISGKEQTLTRESNSVTF